MLALGLDLLYIQYKKVYAGLNMQASSVPALISFVLNVIFSLIAWLYLRRDRINVAFAFFTSVMALCSLACFFMFESFATQPSLVWYHTILALGPILLISANYFILVLTGYIDRLEERLLFIPLKVYLFFTIGYTIVLSVIVHFRFINKYLINFLNPQGANIPVSLRNPGLLIFLIIALSLIAFLTTLVLKALRESKPGPRKNYLRMLSQGLGVIYITGPALKILPFFGIPGYPYIFISTSLGTFFFFMAVVRYQLEQIQELNVGLEQKVKERTRHLRAAQAKLVESEKQASLGRLVAGVAHEFNNPIGAVNSTNSTIHSGLQRLEKLVSESDISPPDQSKMNKLISAIEECRQVNKEGAERLADIVQRMKGFVQLDEAELQKVDIHEGLEDTLAMLPYDKIEKVTIIREYGDLPKVTCYSARMNQVFYNILINGAEAVADDGQIRIKTDSDGENVMVRFIDNGIGIKKEHLDKIFEPGFTTRGVGVGTGLGLTIAYQVIQDHQGEIEVKSGLGKGTEVKLCIPVRTGKRERGLQE
jgi:signal transduction histidine kinase